MNEDLHEEHDMYFYVKILKIGKLWNLNQQDISWFWLGGKPHGCRYFKKSEIRSEELNSLDL
jgi:hypothetical protein